jgi:hypothetical protein
MFKDALGMKAATEAACHFLDGYWVRLDNSPRECAEAVVDAYLEAASPLRWRLATEEDWESCAEFEIIWATPGSGRWAGPCRGMLHEDVPDGDNIIVMVADLMDLPEPP